MTFAVNKPGSLDIRSLPTNYELQVNDSLFQVLVVLFLVPFCCLKLE